MLLLEPGGLFECQEAGVQPEQGMWVRVSDPPPSVLLHHRVRDGAHAGAGIPWMEVLLRRLGEGLQAAVPDLHRQVRGRVPTLGKYVQ